MSLLTLYLRWSRPHVRTGWAEETERVPGGCRENPGMREKGWQGGKEIMVGEQHA